MHSVRFSGIKVMQVQDSSASRDGYGAGKAVKLLLTDDQDGAHLSKYRDLALDRATLLQGCRPGDRDYYEKNVPEGLVVAEFNEAPNFGSGSPKSVMLQSVLTRDEKTAAPDTKYLGFAAKSQVWQPVFPSLEQPRAALLADLMDEVAEVVGKAPDILEIPAIAESIANVKQAGVFIQGFGEYLRQPKKR